MKKEQPPDSSVEKVPDIAEAFDEFYAKLSDEDKEAFDKRIIEISEMYGSGGP